MVSLSAKTQIGILPRGVNPPSANMLTFSGSYVALAIKTGIMTGILSLTVRQISMKLHCSDVNL
jgi:hypothetical protein